MRLLFICHGNRFRSPYAAGVSQILRPTFEIRSAGVKDPIGSYPAAKPTREAAERRGFSLANHRAQLVTRAMIDWADMVLYMDGGNLRRLLARFPDARERFFCLASFVDQTRIPDPCFTTDKEPIWDLIEEACRSLPAYASV